MRSSRFHADWFMLRAQQWHQWCNVAFTVQTCSSSYLCFSATLLLKYKGRGSSCLLLWGGGLCFDQSVPPRCIKKLVTTQTFALALQKADDSKSIFQLVRQVNKLVSKRWWNASTSFDVFFLFLPGSQSVMHRHRWGRLLSQNMKVTLKRPSFVLQIFWNLQSRQQHESRDVLDTGVCFPSVLPIWQLGQC